jgi:hypothetical protein
VGGAVTLGADELAPLVCDTHDQVQQRFISIWGMQRRLDFHRHQETCISRKPHSLAHILVDMTGH